MTDDIKKLRAAAERKIASSDAGTSDARTILSLLSSLEEARAEAGKLRDLIINFVVAWEKLPEGTHPMRDVQTWLVQDMKPSVDAARQALEVTK